MEKNLIILTKDANNISYVVDETKSVTREEVKDYLSADAYDVDLETLKKKVEEAEENLVNIVNEIDTKVSEREQEQYKEFNAEIEEAKKVRDLAIQEAYEKYNQVVSNVFMAEKTFARSICDFKENSIKEANQKLTNARHDLEDAEITLKTVKEKEEIYSELLAKMDECIEQEEVIEKVEETPEEQEETVEKVEEPTLAVFNKPTEEVSQPKVLNLTAPLINKLKF